MKFKDVLGQKFNNLTVISRALNDKNNRTILNCVCDCGKKIQLVSREVRMGRTKSCGCHKKKWAPFKKKRSKIDAKIRTSLAKTNAGFKHLYLGYFYGSISRNKKFNLSIEEFARLTKLNCHYCNREPKQISQTNVGKDSYVYNGLDRMDNSKGYEISNVVPCCKICNMAKHTMPKAEFELWIKDLIKFQIANIYKL